MYDHRWKIGRDSSSPLETEGKRLKQRRERRLRLECFGIAIPYRGRHARSRLAFDGLAARWKDVVNVS